MFVCGGTYELVESGLIVRDLGVFVVLGGLREARNFRGVDDERGRGREGGEETYPNGGEDKKSRAQ